MRCEVRSHTYGVRTAARGLAVLRIAFLLLGISLAVTACSFSEPEPKRAAAPVADSNEPKPPTPMDTFRTLAPPEGLKFTQLFSDPVDDVDERIGRLERAVQSLRNDFDTVVPSMVRMVAIEKDIKQLVVQLQTLTDGGAAPPAAPTEDVEQAPIGSTAAVFPPPLPDQPKQNSEIPSGDVAGGTEPAPTAPAVAAGTPTNNPLVTPEASPKGKLPPEGEASPNSKPPAEKPIDVTAPVASDAEKPAAAAPAPAEKPDHKATVVPGQSSAVVPPLSFAQEADKKAASNTAPQALTKTSDVSATTAPAAAPIPTPPTPQPAVEAKKTPDVKPTETAPPKPLPPAAIVEDVKNIRTADHPDKTRIVLDLIRQENAKVTLSEKGKTLIVEFKTLNLSTIKAFEADTANLVAGYHVEGQKIIFDLLYPSDIKANQILPPNGTPYYRLVIDLFSKDVHHAK